MGAGKVKLAALLLTAVVTLAGCVSGPPSNEQISDNAGNGTWSYVRGPHGENCLVWSVNIGSNSGLFAMSCDSVRPGK